MAPRPEITVPLCGLSLYLWGQALAGACGRRLEGRHLVYVRNYIHTEGVRPRPANGGGGIQGRRMHCMRRNAPISIPNVALRGIANFTKRNIELLVLLVHTPAVDRGPKIG